MNQDIARRGRLIARVLAAGLLTAAGPALAQDLPGPLEDQDSTAPPIPDAGVYESYDAGFDEQDPSDDWYFDYYELDDASAGQALEADGEDAPMDPYDPQSDLFESGDAIDVDPDVNPSDADDDDLLE